MANILVAFLDARGVLLLLVVVVFEVAFWCVALPLVESVNDSSVMDDNKAPMLFTDAVMITYVSCCIFSLF